MERIILVDSSVFIRLMRLGHDPALALLERFDTLDLVTCGMVKLEVLRGVRNPAAKERLKALMSVMIFVSTDQRLWEDAIQLAWDLDRSGRMLPAPDILIAVCASRVGAEILTLDKHFAQIPDALLTPVPDEWKYDE